MAIVMLLSLAVLKVLDYHMHLSLLEEILGLYLWPEINKNYKEEYNK